MPRVRSFPADQEAEERPGRSTDHCGASWDEGSETNSLRPGVVSSDTDAVASARWSGKLLPPSCRSSAVLAAIRRVDKLSDRKQLELILYIQIKTLL